MIMTKSLSVIYQYIAPAHRAIWRGDIFWLLIAVFWYASHPSPHTFWEPAGLVILFFGLSIFHVISELRHPKLDYLGFSGPKEAKYWFVGFGALFTGSVVASNVLGHMRTDWLWLAIALFTTIVFYFIRPKVGTPSNPLQN